MNIHSSVENSTNISCRNFHICTTRWRISMCIKLCFCWRHETFVIRFFFKKAPVIDENSLTHDSKLKNCRLRMTLCRQQLELLALEFSSKRFAAPWLKINKNFSNFKRIPQETFFLFPDRCEMGTIYINHHLSFRNSLLPPFRAKHDSMLGEFLHKTNLSHQLHQT